MEYVSYHKRGGIFGNTKPENRARLLKSLHANFARHMKRNFPTITPEQIEEAWVAEEGREDVMPPLSKLDYSIVSKEFSLIPKEKPEAKERRIQIYKPRKFPMPTAQIIDEWTTEMLELEKAREELRKDQHEITLRIRNIHNKLKRSEQAIPGPAKKPSKKKGGFYLM